MTEPIVAPAPATIVTDSAASPPVVIPAAPVTPASAPVTPTAPAPTPGSPEAIAAEKRVQDAQRAMHAATTEASQLRTQLNAIINHPLLGPVARQVTRTPLQTQPDDALDQAWKDYQSAPSDREAFGKLMQHASEASYQRIRKEAEGNREKRVNAARAQQRDTAIAQFINDTVSKDAPDVPLDVFWAMSQRAETETPLTIVTLPERLEWQVARAIELGRALLAPKATAAAETAQAGAALTSRAGAVMPGGGSSPTTVPGSIGKVPTMIEQIKSAQSRTVGKV